MATEQQLQDFDSAFNDDVQTITAAGSGPWAAELNELLQKSGQAVIDGSPGVAATSTYAQLISLVQRASAMNLSQAELKQRIEALGSNAIGIAKTVRGLAFLFS